MTFGEGKELEFREGEDWFIATQSPVGIDLSLHNHRNLTSLGK